MEDMDSLLTKLSLAGVEFNLLIREALMNLDIRNFSNMNPKSFFQDRPLVFLENERGGVKTISAPHMILTLLHHLELKQGMDVIIIGSKGGYISALVNEIVGESGSITLLDYDAEVLEHAKKSHKISGCYDLIKRKKLRRDGRRPIGLCSNISRVLITGSIKSLPNWIDSSICDGGFIIYPDGSRINQKLIKRERQGTEFFDTDLGDVVFGPLDIRDSEPITPSPLELAEIFEQVTMIAEEYQLIDNDLSKKLDDLIIKLRLIHNEKEILKKINMEEATEKMMILLNQSESWMSKLWPIFLMISEIDICSMIEFNDSEDYFYNGHEDMIP